MARERKKIAGRKGGPEKGAPDVSMATSSTPPLAKPAARSHSQDQFHALIRALAQELARQDHGRDAD
jgi:hypothetical protein|tara:strand:+ start:19452 stop:19652 length:201 start_codon:yes stop_codon:yes gene_type:complete